MKLKICHFSDTHGKHKQIVVPECDILICSGDVSPLGYVYSLREYAKWFTKQTQATWRVWIGGNHDRKLDPKFQHIDSHIVEEEVFKPYGINEAGSNTFYLENNSVEIMNINIWGSPVTPWFHGNTWAFNKHRGHEIEEVWKNIPIDTDILVTHGPPKFKLDKTTNPPSSSEPNYHLISDGYVGCDRLAYHVKRVKPLLHLFGHIHEEYGYCYDEDSNYFNGSICNLRYEAVNHPWLIEADFHEKEISIIT